MNDVTIAIMTWLRYEERWQYFLRTLEGLEKHLDGGMDARYLVSAEREGSLHAEDLERVCRGRGITLLWHEGVADIGDHMNAMIPAIRTPRVLYVQDDWELKVPLDIGPDLDAMRAGEADMVRYAWWTLPDRAPTLASSAVAGGDDRHWHLDPGHFPAYPAYFSHHPYATNVDVYSRVGPFVRNGRDKGFAFGEMDYDLRVRSAGIKVLGRSYMPIDAKSWKFWFQYFHHNGKVSAMTEKWAIAKGRR